MGRQDYRISVRRPADSRVIIQVSGEIDVTSSLAFKDDLFGAVTEGAVHVVVDLHAADYVDTYILSVLVDLARRCRLEDRELVIVCSAGKMREALARTGVDQMVATHATLDEALGPGGPTP